MECKHMRCHQCGPTSLALDERGKADAAEAELAALRAEVERLRGVHGSLRDWAQGRVETLTRCCKLPHVGFGTAAEMMYERTIMRDIVAMLEEPSGEHVEGRGDE